MNGTISNNSDERGLLPYPVILAATKGDPDAMKLVLQHYQSYIAHLSMQKIRDESGNTYWGICGVGSLWRSVLKEVVKP